MILIFYGVSLILNEQVEGGWILEGQKRWIGNSTFADVLVVFARNATTNQINGYEMSPHLHYLVSAFSYMKMKC